MSNLKLFQYAVLLHPTEEEAKNGVLTKIITPITTELAENEKELTFKIARKLPDDMMDKLKRTEILIRPF